MIDIKQIKKQLQDLEYVKTIKSLTKEQREILAKRWQTRHYISVKIPTSKIKCPSSAKLIFADVVANLEKKIAQERLTDLKPASRYYNENRVTASGVVNITDKELIQLHIKYLTRQHNLKIEKQKEAVRKAKARKSTNVSLTVASRRDAEILIKHLKNKFKV
jgi:hypothetical protein